MVRIATGQYTGNGKVGSTAARTLDFSSTLGRPPQLVVVRPRDSGGEGMILPRGITTTMWNLSGNYGSGGMNRVSWSGNAVSWYADDVGSMFNTEGKVYVYFAIG